MLENKQDGALRSCTGDRLAFVFKELWKNPVQCVKVLVSQLSVSDKYS